MTTPPIDWSAQEHAYGPATDVPELLAQLSHKDSAVRRKAFDKLANRINHQGWASPVARLVVPFLIEALRAAKTPGEKARLLVLLGELAPGGNHQSCLAAGYGSAYGSLSLSEPLDAALHEAVRAGSSTFRDLLDDKSAAVRAAAAFTLGLLGPERTHFDALRARADVEKDSAVLASLILSLGLLSQGLKDDSLKPLFVSKLADTEAAVRIAAASALVWCSPQDISVPTLLDLAESDITAKDVPFAEGKLSRLALTSAGTLMSTTGSFNAFDRVVALNSRLHAQVLPAIAKAVLRSGDTVPEEPKHRQQLTDDEVAFLEKVVALDLTHRLRLPLIGSGLMFSTPALRQLLHPEPDAVLERLVDGKPLWKHAWRTLDGLSDFEEWRAALASLALPEKEQALLELARLPYLIWLRWDTQSERWQPLAELILETARAEGITPNLDHWLATASPKVAAAVLGTFVAEEERAAWAQTHQNLLVRAAANLPRHALPLVRALDLEDRERLVLSVPRLSALVLAELSPTPSVAARTAVTAQFAADYDFRSFAREDWRRLLSHFGPDALPTFEEAAQNKEIPIRDLFAEAAARLRSQSS